MVAAAHWDLQSEKHVKQQIPSSSKTVSTNHAEVLVAIFTDNKMIKINFKGLLWALQIVVKQYKTLK